VSTLDFDFLAEFFITNFSATGGFDLSDADVSIERCLSGSKGCLCFSFFAITLSLLDCSLGVDPGDISILLSDTLGFSYVTLTLCFGDIDTGLIDCSLVSLSG
jgi:hypothetical protein